MDMLVLYFVHRDTRQYRPIYLARYVPIFQTDPLMVDGWMDQFSGPPPVLEGARVPVSLARLGKWGSMLHVLESGIERGEPAAMYDPEHYVTWQN